MSGTKRATTNTAATMPFRDAIDNYLLYQSSLEKKLQLGENGMPEYTAHGVGSNVLALSQMVRGGDPQGLVETILATGSTHEVADLIVLLFVTRNCRGGKGEKKLAFDIFLRVWIEYPKTGEQLLRLFPHFGYWKDLLLLMAAAKSEAWFSPQKTLITASMAVMKDQLVEDIATLKDQFVKDMPTLESCKKESKGDNSPKISLLAKWLPREGSSFDKKVGFVTAFASILWPDMATSAAADSTSWQSAAKARYRRVVAQLTSALALPEVLLAAQREDEIRFGRMASKATLRLRKVLLNETEHGDVRSENPKRIRLAERFLSHVVTNGLKGAQLMPHEIVSKILDRAYSKMSKEEELVLDAQWKDLWKSVVDQVKAKAAEEDGGAGLDFNPTRMVPMADVSGSMTGVPMAVSIALSIGISEITHDAFKDMVLTFSSQPRWHRLNRKDTIVQKVRSLMNAHWQMSTNFEAAYDLILDIVKSNKLGREDMPSLIVFSDMQFDMASARVDRSKTVQDLIRGKVKKVAHRLGWEDSDPTPMVYWNLRNSRGGHPVNKDSEGAVMLSGFSPALLKLVMHGEALREQEVEVVQKDGSVVTKKVQVTPEEVLQKMLDDKLYDPVREILMTSREGKLLEYEIPSLLAERMEQDRIDEDFALV